MSDRPILLFLHGVGTGDREDLWKARLTETLTALGYPHLDTAEVIAPKYAHALRGWDEKVDLPPITVKQPGRDAARQNRRVFERRMGAIEFRLGRHSPGSGLPGGDVAVGAAVALPSFKQARSYLTDGRIRAQVLDRILAKLPSSGRIVIVGHSLGSVIAADLVRRLPVALEVVGMITIGSPLAHAGFDVDKLRESLKEPPANLAWWVNFWNTSDLVAAHRGLSSVFPWMIDFRIDTKAPPSKRAHSAIEYLGADVVAEAIGFALFGSRSKEVARIGRVADIPPDATELLALLALRYAHLIKLGLEGDVRERFAGALRSVQATVVDELVARNAVTGRQTPAALASLAFDLSDPAVDAPEPAPAVHIVKDEAVVVLTLLASENLIRPFEISIPTEKLRGAMQDLTAEMGLGSKYGTDVFDASKTAREILAGRTVNWLKWGALGAGAAAIIVATGGLALAAGAGLAGAAVVTSALATFGPGGMIGGLLTAGTLVTAGGGGIALGLASPNTTAEALEEVVQRLLSTEILRRRQHLESDPSVWQTLVETEINVRREHERLDEFSDPSAPGIKQLKAKIVAVERALDYLRENALEPEVEAALET
ncbi:lipase family protein [Microbacterium sp. zg-YB36]|uniref:lipase family protein n=1 Tax=Microbacterium sp. zg-YB36 TaxID=2969407 RepID=UPI00214B4960|nr:lipase family protein [Microbacterium sp. zg-YB36]MDL5350937.1 lipase family protein [Microbacterium sp. zg-YB36]